MTLPAEIRTLLDGPDGETFKKLVEQYSAELVRLNADALAQLRAATDDATRLTIVTGIIDKVRQWLKAPVDAQA